MTSNTTKLVQRGASTIAKELPRKQPTTFKQRQQRWKVSTFYPSARAKYYVKWAITRPHYFWLLNLTNTGKANYFLRQLANRYL